MNYRSVITRSIRRFGRVVGVPVALFLLFATLFSNIGNVIRSHQDDSHLASAGDKGNKLPYEPPSFDVFEGVFSSDAQAIAIDGTDGSP